MHLKCRINKLVRLILGGGVIPQCKPYIKDKSWCVCLFDVCARSKAFTNSQVLLLSVGKVFPLSLSLSDSRSHGF